MRRLIVTNGQSAADAIRRAGIPFETVLPWNDVLHEGPVRDHRQDSAFRRERSEYLSRRGYGSAHDILSALTRRDEALGRGLDEFDEVVLWFEHDLYDQLQLLHVLSRIARTERAASVLMVSMSQFIAEAKPEELVASFRGRDLAEDETIYRGLRGWMALTAPTPEPLAVLAAGTECELLPHLQNAVNRMLQELCEPSTGLSRSQLQILNVLMKGPQRPAVLFRRCSEMEEAKFVGDWSFWAMVSDLSSGVNRLVESPANSPQEGAMAPDSVFFETRLSLTVMGRDIVEGRRNAIDLIGLDRWVGGTRLHPGRYWTFADGNLRGPFCRCGSGSS